MKLLFFIYDTIYMTILMQQESIDINFSLMALKDCIHGYYNNNLNHNNHKVLLIIEQVY